MGLHDLHLYENANPVQYFETVMNMISFAFKCTTMKKFWWNQEEYLEILQVSQEKFYHLSTVSPIYVNFEIILLFI